MLSGLNSQTPLGQIVSIRAEKDPEIIKSFSREEKRIHNEYQRKLAKEKSKEEVDAAIESFRQAFIRLAGGENNEKAQM